MKATESFSLLYLALLCFASASTQGAELQGLSGAVIKSDRWVVRRDKAEEEFSGNVSYSRDGTRIECEWALHDKKRAVLKLRGNIHITRLLASGDILEAWGDTGTYEIKTRKTRLASRPLAAPSRSSGTFEAPEVRDELAAPGAPEVLIRAPVALFRNESAPVRFRKQTRGQAAFSGRSFEGTARTAEWSGEKNQVRLSGNVELSSKGSEAVPRRRGSEADPAGRPAGRYNHPIRTLSEEALYDHAGKTLEIFGGPPVVSAETDRFSISFQAGKVTFFIDRGILRGQTQVRGWIKFSGTQGKGNR